MSEKSRVQNCKKKIERFSKYNDNEIKKFFEKVKYGNIVMEYPADYEMKIYKTVEELLRAKYPEFCDEENLSEILSLYGHIYTAQLRKGIGNGIYHIDSGNILLYSFINKLSKNLIHEIIHKLGYLRFNEDFYSMHEIYKEAGTELISNTILNGPLCKEMVIGRMRARCVGVQPEYLVETILVNQINMACGNHTLEKSIIKGENYFEPRIEELVGKEAAKEIYNKLQTICLSEKNFWKKSQWVNQEKNITKKIMEYQELVMTKIFDSRIKQISNKDDAQNLLEELMNFSDFRVKFYAPKEKDYKFLEYFEKNKKELEKRFDTVFSIEDISEEWDSKYPFIKLEQEEINREKLEKEKINRLTEKRNTTFWQRLFGKKQISLPEKGEYKELEQVNFTIKMKESGFDSKEHINANKNKNNIENKKEDKE